MSSTFLVIICTIIFNSVISALFIISNPLDAKWRLGHHPVFSIPVGPWQAVKLAPR